LRFQVPFYTLLFSLLLILSNKTFSQSNILSEQHLNSIYKPPVFESLTTTNGLPENTVGSILQDYLGYLWLGTQNGLVQYDGYSMKVFHLERDSINILSTMDLVIYEDKDKMLWVGTLGGLNKFDRTSESFKLYKHDAYDTTTLNSNLIRSFYEDKSGRFWIGTQQGLNLFDREKEIFTRYYFENPRKTILQKSNHYPVNTIVEDPLSGDLLIGTEMNGLWKFDVEEKRFIKYSDDNLDENIGCVQTFCKARDGKIWMASANTLSSLDPRRKEFEFYINFSTSGDEQNIIFTNPIGSVVEDRDGLIWSGFFKGEKGVFCLNPVSGELYQYDLFPDKPRQARYNKILSLYVDRTGIIWIGTWLSGIKKLDKRKNQFRFLKSSTDFLPNSLSHSLVYNVTQDSEGSLWFCTHKSLDKYDVKSGTYKHYLKDEECITSYAYISYQDQSGYIWLGTSNCGLIRFNSTNGLYNFYFNKPYESINLVNKQVLSLFQDHLGILWIGTNGFGLYKFDVKNNKATVFKNDPDDPTSLSNDQVLEIFEDSYGNLWIGTNLAGLNKFDRDTEKFIHNGFVCISTLFEDKQGNFWVGDFWLGLNVFDREHKVTTKSFSTDDGLLNQNIIGIMEDDHNNLWIATEIGLSKLNLSNGTFRNYTNQDGLPETLTSVSFCFKSSDGEMFINTNEGQVVFHPDNLKDDPIPPQVVLRNLELFNRPGEKLSYKGFISEIKEIILPYNHNDIRFDFVGLHFSSSENNRYKYILENFDNDWIDAGNQRYATYTNLDPGEYIFKVTASNKDGVWNETATSIAIIINPPWYRTTLAYLIYLLIIGCLIYFTWKAQLTRLRIKHEFEMSKFEAQKLYEVDEIKSRFFANISHEFRTPLTLILGPLKEVIKKISDEEIKSVMRLINRNAKKLLSLVNQLLDISKLESGNMKLETEPQNIVPLINNILLTFSTFAESKRIKAKFTSADKEIIVYIDKDKIEKIITNILSNAFKFTPEGGEVEVSINKDNKDVNIIIRDTGIGITEEKLSRIFDRFFQVDGSHTREYEGSGIGLSLTKELIELHKGQIEVESKAGKGSIFTVKIPLGTNHLKQEEINKKPKSFNSAVNRQPYENIIDADEKNEDENVSEFPEKDSLPLLLIVEDNSDVRKYVKDNLKNEYRIIQALDGAEGWNKSTEYIPDLIISDIMMPNLNGFELCRDLKTDERTSHIPVILLTAKATIQDKIEGFETGADEYLMKPFEPQELKARIKNLIAQRKRLHEHFRREGILEVNRLEITSVDKKFLQKVYEIINENISDAGFTNEMFAEKLAISRSLLYKKITSLIGDSPRELIKRIRLHKAAELIERKFGNLSEIALEVGFENPAYFSETFKKQFGVAPSQYKRKSKSQ
jgi:signal transduction histidine kinase/ligand-binding sensor domain-containing protein/DNA-binding NarL/FixJ family response regulator